MYDIEMHKTSEEFTRCWRAAGLHLQACANGTPLSWLKAKLTPPFLEHLSFRAGNQLFFIRIEDVDGKMDVPGNLSGVQYVAEASNGQACMMPMRCVQNEWVPVENGWGLIDTKSRITVDPPALIMDENIEITDWELHDFAVQTVREHIEKKLDHQVMSSQANTNVDPSIWFVGDDGPEWVVVRAVRYPERDAPLPHNMQDIAKFCLKLSHVGYFASVGVANADDAFDGDKAALPLWRGHGMIVSFEGVKPFDNPLK
jgi:hypothetical protein